MNRVTCHSTPRRSRHMLAPSRPRGSEAKFRVLADAIRGWCGYPADVPTFFTMRVDVYRFPPGSTDGAGWSGMFHPRTTARPGRWRHCWRRASLETKRLPRRRVYRWTLGRPADPDEAARSPAGSAPAPTSMTQAAAQRRICWPGTEPRQEHLRGDLRPYALSARHFTRRALRGAVRTRSTPWPGESSSAAQRPLRPLRDADPSRLSGSVPASEAGRTRALSFRRRCDR